MVLTSNHLEYPSNNPKQTYLYSTRPICPLPVHNSDFWLGNLNVLAKPNFTSLGRLEKSVLSLIIMQQLTINQLYTMTLRFLDTSCQEPYTKPSISGTCNQNMNWRSGSSPVIIFHVRNKIQYLELGEDISWLLIWWLTPSNYLLSLSWHHLNHDCCLFKNVRSVIPGGKQSISIPTHLKTAWKYTTCLLPSTHPETSHFLYLTLV